MEPLAIVERDVAIALVEKLPDGVTPPTAIYLASLGEGSRRAIQRSLNLLVETFLLMSQATAAGNPDLHLQFPWWQLRYQHTAAMRSALQDSHAPATANKALTALRQTLKQCWRLGLMPVEDYQAAADVSNIKDDRLPSGRDISTGEVSALLGHCTSNDSNISRRDGAVLACLLVGLRRAEVASLQFSDYTPDDGKLVIRKAKRNKQRTVYLPDGGVRAIADWLEVRGDVTGPLFLRVNKGDAIDFHEKPMSAQAVWGIVERWAKRAGIQNVTPHDFRRTFVGDLLDSGADLSVVQKLAGHSNPATTARYDRRGERAKRDAVARLHIPYRREASI